MTGDEFTRSHADDPCFTISVVARMLRVHPQTLRYYEREGLISPARSLGRLRLYSLADVERLRLIQRLTQEVGVNLAGVQVAIAMIKRIEELLREREKLIAYYNAELERLRRELEKASSDRQEESDGE